MEPASGPPGTPAPRPPGTLAPRDTGAVRLLCVLGFHAPDAAMVWHQGYGFAHCRRCGRAIVRSLLSNWVVPGPGLRIVWPKPGANGASPSPGTGTGSAALDKVGVAEPDKPALDQSETGAASTSRAETPVVAPAASDGSGPDDDAAVPVIVRGKAEPAPRAEQAAPADAAAAAPAPLAVAPNLSPQAIDLLGPNFMGDSGAPPGPRDGMEVFEFDDMAAGGAGFAGGDGRTAQRAS